MGWLIALGVLVVLAILPLGATVRYNALGLVLKLIVGPFRIDILPAKKKKPKEDKKTKSPKEKTKTSQQNSPEDTEDTKEKPEEKGGSITDFIPLVKVALNLLDTFRRKLRINRLELKLILAGNDPCDVALNYGRANAAMGNLLPQLERCFVIKKRDVEIECDFESTETLIIARADITITLGRLLAMLCKYGFLAIKEYIKLKNIRKGGTST